jgi:hypothetical protein
MGGMGMEGRAVKGPTGSQKITGKSNRGKSTYRNKFSDFSVSA